MTVPVSEITRIVLIILELAVLVGVILFITEWAWPEKNCKEEFLSMLTDLEHKACNINEFSEPIEEKLELPSCVEYVTYNSGDKCKEIGDYCRCVKFVDEDEEECTSTLIKFGELPEDVCPVEYVNFRPDTVSKDKGTDYMVILSWGKIELSPCIGKALPCTELSESDCTSQKGCTHFPIMGCKGTAQPCFTFKDRDACTAQKGCEWIGAGPPKPKPRTDRRMIYGISGHWWRLNEYLDVFIYHLTTLGVTNVRLGIDWAQFDKKSGYDWVMFDRILNRLNEEGIRVVGLFVTIPPYLSENPSECESNQLMCKLSHDKVTEFRNAVRAVVERYDFIDHWEFWNEPEMWETMKSPSEYEFWLTNFYDTVKSVDKNKKVAASTLTGWDFLSKIYDSGKFDAIAYHPYAEKSINKNEIERIREEMIKNGDDDKTIWITEYGWCTQPYPCRYPPMSEDEQAENLRDALTWMENHDYIEVADLHMLHDINDAEGKLGYGITTAPPEFRPKKSYYVFKELSEKALLAYDAGCWEKGIVKSKAGKFILNGKRFRFIGVNAKSLKNPKLSDEEVEHAIEYLKSCGVSVIRVFADPDELDMLKRLLSIGSKYNMKFILVLEDCVPGLIHDLANAKGPCPGRDLGEGYVERVEKIVGTLKDEYKNEILAWELANEPHCSYPGNCQARDPGCDTGGECRCTGSDECPTSLRNFVLWMSNYIKSVDPQHMVTIGIIGKDQRGAGIDDDGYEKLHRFPNIDAAEVHYYPESGSSDFVYEALEIANDLGKPFFVEEYGRKKNGRAEKTKEFMEELFSEGASGFIYWDFSIKKLKEYGEYTFFEGDALCDAMRSVSATLCGGS